MKRSALCHCGQLEITAARDPEHVIMCHYSMCQRGTGTSYDLSAWCKRTERTSKGDDKDYTRTGDEGVEITFHLCPECGTTVYLETPALFPAGIAVATGCFADPNVPAPTLSQVDSHRHHWLPKPTNIPGHTGFVNSGYE
jgi:hypothetical protein